MTGPSRSAADTALRDLDGVLTWNLVRVARLMGNRMAARLSEYGLNPIHFGILTFLSSAPEMTTAEIARSVLLRPQSVAPLLDGREERGLVVRTGDRARGRRNPVRITDDGVRVLERMWGVAISTNDLRDVGLDAEDGRRLNDLLLRIVESAGDPWPEPGV